MAVVDGVTQVASVSVNVLQDGDAYSALLEIAHKLHGGCPRKLFYLLDFCVFRCCFPFMRWDSHLCPPLRCSGCAACLRSTSAAPYPRTVWVLVEERPERKGKVWSNCFPHLSAKELHSKETSQYLTSVKCRIDLCWAFCCGLRVLLSSLICVVQGVEIQRVWSLHDVLLSLDYTSEDNKQIIDLLLQCFHRPVYIRNDDVSTMIFSCCVCFRTVPVILCFLFFCFLFFVFFCGLMCELSAWCVYFHRESDSWCFSSAGTSTSSGLFMAPSKTSWSFIASKTIMVLMGLF